ncbi:MAG: nucleoside triphosphate pyrophosphohydrolase [Acutalibacteraceae bacterium]|nr:nucleoside triphosphate pyrophosphohydrolase [Acutalibacteraceae bacterium]
MVKIVAEGANGNYTVSQLLDIMRILRSPEGCPWDREQSHKSIRNDALEEVYEVADAIDNEDAAALCEELGDMLLQVVFHSRIGEENGEFSFSDVVDGICKKLVLRHPHVFGEEHIENSADVLDRWDSIKKEEKNQSTVADTLNSVPKAFPALMRAAKVQKRMKKAGIPMGDPDKALTASFESFKATCSSQDKANLADAYGNLLYALAGMQNALGINCEEALNSATERAIKDVEQREKEGTLFD